MHTNLDTFPKGVSYKMAEKLSLENIQTIDVTSAKLKKLIVYVPKSHAEKLRHTILDAGAGHIGEYDQCSFNIEGKGTFRALKNSKPYVGKIGEIHTEDEIRIETIFPPHLQNEILHQLN